MNTILRTALLALCVFGPLALPATDVAAQQIADAAVDGFEPRWPREWTGSDGTRMTLYQPQVETWTDYKSLEGRIAIAWTPPGAEEAAFGAYEIEAITDVDLESRLVRVRNLKITDGGFPTVSQDLKPVLLKAVKDLSPDGGVVLSLDRMVAALERGQVQTREKPVEVKNDPPRIFTSQFDAVLVVFDGEAIFAPIAETGLSFAVNTNWPMFREGKGAVFLLNESVWWTAPKPEGPWSVTASLPAGFSQLPANDNWTDVQANVPPKSSTSPGLDIFVSTEPAELLLLDGGPEFTQIPGVALLQVTNTESDLLLSSQDGQYYYLVAGRWFRAPWIDGPWAFAGDSLPADLAHIPRDHPAARVLSSVPGSPEAEEAILTAQIPETATVSRKGVVDMEVTWDGDPEFKAIEGTEALAGVNTGEDVFKVGDLYYTCFQGVWFMSTKAQGPWEASTEVPPTIYDIPSSSSKHHVTYVYIYETTPDVVVYGYTSGYVGMYWWTGALVWGTGWYYRPYVHWGPSYYPVYYRHPYTYGGGCRYNYHTGYYGHSARGYGPYGSAGATARYNPRTGTYSRSASVSGPGGWAAGGQAYNPRTGRSVSTRQGGNVYGSWGSTTVRRGNDWARTERYSNHSGTARAVDTSRRGSGASYHGNAGNGVVYRDDNNNVYAGRDGNVYKRSEGGSWSQYGNKGWDKSGWSGSGRSSSTRSNSIRSYDSTSLSGRTDGTSLSGRTGSTSLSGRTGSTTRSGTGFERGGDASRSKFTTSTKSQVSRDYKSRGTGSSRTRSSRTRSSSSSRGGSRRR